MNWTSLFGLLSIIVFMTIFEWPHIKQKKEKAAFAVLTAIGCLLAFLLLWNPNLPNPDQFIEAIYRPLGKLLE